MRSALIGTTWAALGLVGAALGWMSSRRRRRLQEPEPARARRAEHSVETAMWRQGRVTAFPLYLACVGAYGVFGLSGEQLGALFGLAGAALGISTAAAGSRLRGR